jgi:hypothetical protein
MRRQTGTIFFLAAAAFSGGAAAADHWSVEAYGGSAYNFRNRLSISQEGSPSQSVDAKYETRGLRAPPYYILRAARWSGDAAWEISQIHHKLYLTNPPPGVGDVSISHGFNILTVNRAYRAGDWTYRIGAGPVVTHAEATINGTKYDGPYKLSGAALLAGAGWRYYVTESTFFSVEGLLTLARANPKLPGPPDGELRATNTAIHAAFGLGHDF